MYTFGAADLVPQWALDNSFRLRRPPAGHAGKPQGRDRSGLRPRQVVRFLANCSTQSPKMTEPVGSLVSISEWRRSPPIRMGNLHGGSEMKSVRHRQRRLRAKLQARQTRSAKRRLQKLSRQRTPLCQTMVFLRRSLPPPNAPGIAVEELTGIRDWMRATRRQRGVLHSWAFAQLRAFLEYKAKLAAVGLLPWSPETAAGSVPLAPTRPKRTGPTNRLSVAPVCGFAMHAGRNAAQGDLWQGRRKRAERSESCCCLAMAPLQSRRLQACPKAFRYAVG
jgi:hypothetical protein